MGGELVEAVGSVAVDVERSTPAGVNSCLGEVVACSLLLGIGSLVGEVADPFLPVDDGPQLRWRRGTGQTGISLRRRHWRCPEQIRSTPSPRNLPRADEEDDYRGTMREV